MKIKCGLFFTSQMNTRTEYRKTFMFVSFYEFFYSRECNELSSRQQQQTNNNDFRFDLWQCNDSWRKPPKTMINLNTHHTNRLFEEISLNRTQIIRIWENAWVWIDWRELIQNGIDQKVINIHIVYVLYMYVRECFNNISASPFNHIWT